MKKKTNQIIYNKYYQESFKLKFIDVLTFTATGEPEGHKRPDDAENISRENRVHLSEDNKLKLIYYQLQEKVTTNSITQIQT